MRKKQGWAIRLSEADLRYWLRTHGVDCADVFWEHLRYESLTSNRLIKAEVPVYVEIWPGNVDVIAWLACKSKIAKWRWPIYMAISANHRNELLIKSITLRATISLPRELPRTSWGVSPRLSKPEFGLCLENPSIAQLERAWEQMKQIGLEMKTAFEDIIAVIEKGSQTDQDL